MPLSLHSPHRAFPAGAGSAPFSGLDDLGGSAAAAGENFMGLANRRTDVDSYELAQLRAQIGRIAAKSGVPVNPKHVQVPDP